ncbi:component of RNA polymerase transcription factor TFIIH, Ssl1p [Trichosporon asahii var. asahii CBS 8904]|uniref:Component of RNA polymerase transcription factor TFIIH, Ssl1p n=1 Tax=Trichosporon asahii var. asahii (strain CBS 8904) TaxID=1220162 RepID=K1VJ30_TRIAC|nr:component of RNA polymerase transcription factor TFIIH, Ssl1p [Trichosporon asahii var. asahii CBS 8904]
MPADEPYDPAQSPASVLDSDDDLDRPGPSKKSRKGKDKANGKSVNAWEETYKRSWDVVREDETGGLQAAVDQLIARGRRKRAVATITSAAHVRRRRPLGLDERQGLPSHPYLRSFVIEWFDQNPLGQIGIILLRNRLAQTLVPMCGNPQEIIEALADKRKLEPAGEPSLQNGLVMARGGMSHLPSTSSLEVLVLFSAISTADPDGSMNIHQVLDELVSARVRVTIISLSAEIKICKQIAERTGGRFGVAIDEDHYKELLWETIPPPAQTITAPVTANVREALARGGRQAPGAPKRPPPLGDLLVMGFPTRLPGAGESFCACHGLLKRGGYMCPRCGAKLCDVPTDCEVCGLMVVSSPHLARSFWLLFPVSKYDTLGRGVLTKEAVRAECFGCDAPFPTSWQTHRCRRMRISRQVDDTGAPSARTTSAQTVTFRCSQ